MVRDRGDFRSRHLSGFTAHDRIGVVAPRAAGECRELTLKIYLRFSIEGRGAGLAVVAAMAGCARRDAAHGIADTNQCRRIGEPVIPLEAR